MSKLQTAKAFLSSKKSKRNAADKAASRNQKALNDAITLETLETRQLMTVLSVTDFGAASNGSGNAQSAVQAALNAAKPGDTVSFPAGSYTIDGSVNVPSGVTVIGDSGGNSHIKFNLSGQQLYGFVLNGNDSNVTIKDLDVVSSNGIISMMNGSAYNNTLITDNRFEYGGGQVGGNLVYGISITVGNNATDITYNYFHDSPHSNRNWCIFASTNSHFDHNTFYNVFDGGQLQYIGANDTFDYNYATDLQNKLQEGDISNATNFQAIGNVAYDWASTNQSSMGLSLLSNTAGTVAAGWSVEIENNYIDLALAGNGAGGTSGVVMEVGGGPLTVSGNILGDSTAPSIIQTDTAGSIATNNQMFGANSWGYYSVEAGPSGTYGAWTTDTGSYNGNLSAMPAAPANNNWYLGSGGTGPVTSGSTGSSGSAGSSSSSISSTGSGSSSSTGSTGTGSSTTDPVAVLTGTADGISGLTAKVLSNNSVQLSWTTAAGTTLSSAQVTMITTVGRQSYPTVIYDGNVDSATILQLHPGWQYDFSIIGTTTTGATVTSQVLTIGTTGTSTAGYTLAPTPGTGTLVGGAIVTGTTKTDTTGTASTGSTSTGSTSTGASTGSTASTAGITGVTSTVLSSNSVQLSWTNPTGVTVTSASVEIITTVGQQTFPAVVVDGNVDTITLEQLHPGWQYNFTIVGTTSTGQTVTSNVLTVQTTGNSAPAYTLNPIAQPAASGSSNTGTTTAAAITGVFSKVLSNNRVQLSWTNPAGVTLTSASIEIITTVGHQTFPAVVVDGNVDTATLEQLHPGWLYNFTIVGTTSTGQTVTSNLITVQTTGNSVPAYTLAPIAQPAPVISASDALATTTAGITGLTATALSNTSVQLSWTNQNVTLTSAMVNIITTVGRQSYAGITVTGDADGLVVTGLHAGWKFDFSITGTAADGSTVTSGVVTAQTTGSSTSVGDTLGSLNFGSLLLAA
jgi:hypothetical protein